MEPAQILGFCTQKRPEGKPGIIQEFRDTMHKELDKFLDKLTVVSEKDERPTVADLSDFMTECRQDFLGSCHQHLIEGKPSGGQLNP